ncbi:probable inactive receptor kinase At1g48480 [Punica granatum]|uniref:Protein kinase domain-containing protein n=2 Tax=Punica granatum TaxID=22663 RepID=A0A218XSE8_PUNGR|nr:probable inactive receptor kinase At1g48480 [Punica granatum]OWM87750.1 hypothetical protein CDL15_Pgr016446 [Punica granatum]PKI63335.1 hypothetical protein CRG98_016223 [Punica granatum]
MGSWSLSKILLASVLITFSNQNVAGGGPATGYDRQERDALYALKANFNHPFLNKNWTGLQCYMNEPPYWYGIQCINGRVTGILLENMDLTGTIKFDTFIFLPELVALSFRNNSLTGTLMNFAANQQLTSVDLSGNKFHGPISQSLASLDLLISLQLQGNNLTGQIPEFDQPTLILFNVSNNNLSGLIPSTRTLQSFGPDSFLDNPKLCGPPTLNSCNLSTSKEQQDGSQAPEQPPGESNTKSNKKNSSLSHYAVIFLLFDVVGLVAVVILFFLYYKKSKELKKFMKDENKEEEEEEEEDERVRVQVQVQGRRLEEANRDQEKPEEAVVEGRRSVFGAEEKEGKLVFMDKSIANFELSDLLKATAEGLGRGIFGNSYKALLEDGQAVVVKRLRDLKPMTDEEFTRKLISVASLSHLNLLPPLAYYYSKDEKLLVYRFAEKGNLFNRIHGGRGGRDRVPFRWNARLSAARGAALALEHLHRSSRASNGIVPHGNLKSSNVLFDQNGEVLITDYGFASLIAAPIACHSMMAYKSPEYQSSKRISHKSDVWSYGALLLELLSGRISAFSAPPGTSGVNLCTWVHRAVREEWTAEIFDVEISVQRNAAPGMLRLLQLALRCCDNAPERRPEMAEIVRELASMKPVDSEDESDMSYDRSLTDESASTSASGPAGDEKSR